MQKLNDGKCATCGGTDLMPAEDMTNYTPCEQMGDKWVRTYTNPEPSGADDAVRFFCSDCGTPHEVPKELL